MKGFLFTVVLLLILTISAESRQAVDPFIYLEWLNDPQQEMVINWVNEPGSGTSIQYRERNSSSEWNQRSASVISIPGSTKQVYRVILDELAAGTSYEFEAAGFSRHNFRTAPATLEEPLRFVVGGDLYGFRDTPEEQQIVIDNFTKISREAAKNDPYFAVAGGDLAHAMANPDLVYLWFEMLDIWYQEMVTPDGYLIPIVAGIGNNESPNGFGDSPASASLFRTFLTFPKDQWINGNRHYGVLDFGDYLSLIVLDSGHTDQVSGSQTSWLETTLNQRNNFTHVYPIYHVSAWPTHRTLRGPLEDLLRNSWHPIFRKYGIRFVFEHHDHIYKRTKMIGDCTIPINDNRSCEFVADGVIYLGGGPWGSEALQPSSRSEPNGDWYHETFRTDNNVVLVEITESTRAITTLSVDNLVIDETKDFFRLPPPETLMVTDADTASFRATWDTVEGATNYRIDVAYDESFQNYVDGYRSRRVTNNGIIVDELDINSDYYFRVRAQNELTISNRSKPEPAYLAPKPPEFVNVNDVNVTRFRVNWSESERATNYIFDLAHDVNFSSPVEGYFGVNVDSGTTILVEGRNPDTQYFYRIRPQRFNSTGENTMVNSAQTLDISENLSNVDFSANKILANGEQAAIVTVTLTGSSGNTLSGVPLRLMSNNENVSISNNSEETNQFGEIIFSINNTEAEVVNFNFFVTDTQLFGTESIEFIPVTSSVVLSDNFPNPFRNSTNIPVTLPENSRVRLVIYNSIGHLVTELIDGELNAGYYEFEFNASGLSSGVYFYRLTTKDGSLVENMMLVK